MKSQARGTNCGGPKPSKMRRASAFAAAAALGAMVVSGVARADDISNNLDASIDSVAEVMPLNVGGANGTTTLYLMPQNGDGKNGCNLTGSTTLGLSVSSSNASVATVNPSSVTFTSCGDTKILTVTPGVQGSATISVSQTSNNSGGTFNLAPATFTVNVVASSANTAPTVTVDGVVGGASYNKGSVPAATCQVTDAEDGNSSFAATLSAITGSYASDGIGSQTASCSYTDGGGLPASASATYSIVDPSAPSISYVVVLAAPDGTNGWYKSDVTLTWTVSDLDSPSSLQKTGCVDQNISADQADTTYSCSATSAGGSSGPVSVTIKRDATRPTINGSATPAANANGWNNTDVTVSFSCSDSLSGVTSCSPDETLSTEGAGQSSTGTAVDGAGNSDIATVSNINIDLTAPTITGSRTPLANANGWNNTDVTVSFSCGDSLSGVASCSPNATLTGEGASQSATGNAMDNAGNTNSATASGINIDKTAPTVSLVGGPANGASYYFGSVPAAPTCSASDALSGLAGSCSVSGYLTTVGTHTVTSSATDKAGNVASDSSTYTVLSWRLSGFYQPVDMNSGTTTVWNVVKNGSTVPLKFEVFAGSTELTNTSIVNQPLKAIGVSCAPNPLTDDIELVATGGTTLRYDSSGGQFVYNWQTPKKPGACYKVTVETADGSSISAYFLMK